MLLDAVQARVVGSLIEKQLATPQQYPLTLNALVLACNQASNREPVVTYDEEVVTEALGALKEQHLVRFVLPSHGRSVVRYRQVLDEAFGLDDEQLALLSLLLVRGPQTIGELRARAERLCDFDDSAAVERSLVSLADSAADLIVRLPRRPGQKEERWSETVSARREGEDPGDVVVAPGAAPADWSAPMTDVADRASAIGRSEELDALRQAMAELTERIDGLEARLTSLQDELGG